MISGRNENGCRNFCQKGYRSRSKQRAEQRELYLCYAVIFHHLESSNSDVRKLIINM